MDLLIASIIILTVSIITRHLSAFYKKTTVLSSSGEIVLKYPALVAEIGFFAMGFGVLIVVITVTQLILTTGNEVVYFENFISAAAASLYKFSSS